jgi:hypothetical protein
VRSKSVDFIKTKWLKLQQNIGLRYDSDYFYRSHTMKSKYDISKMESARNPYAAKLKQQPSSRKIKKANAQTDTINPEESDNAVNQNEKDTLSQLREVVRLRVLAKGRGGKKK